MSEQPTNSKNNAKWDALKAKSNVFAQTIGKPFNALSRKLGAEAFMPSDLAQESDKAARILRSFCIDGVMTEDPNDKSSNAKHKKALQKIPPEVIRNAKGLAIFTTFRIGLHASGAGGSGVIVKRLPDGRWSAPSGIMVHTLGYGFLIGADIYDCVVVINNDQGMDGFTRVRATIGAEVSAAVGPMGAGGTVDSEVFKRQAPVWTYTRSKGLYVGAQIDGTIIVERDQENQRFYGVKDIRHAAILSGQVQPPSGTAVQLWETLQAAEGKQYNNEYLPPPDYAPPSDYSEHAPQHETVPGYSGPADGHTHVPDQKS